MREMDEKRIEREREIGEEEKKGRNEVKSDGRKLKLAPILKRV